MNIPKRKLMGYTRGFGVASEEPLASAAGLRVLLNGGNAADAAVAISLSLAVVVPHLGGVGGDLFAVVQDANGEINIINGSGYAPRGLTKSLLASRGLSHVPDIGPLSPVVPGMIDGLRLLHERFGSLEWESVVKPALDIAREGFPSSPALAKALRTSRKILAKDRGSKMTYLDKGIENEGSLVKFQGLARLLELLSEDSRIFYEGEVAERIVNYVTSVGGVMDQRDFKEYRATLERPLSDNYKEWEVLELPPNSQGLTTLLLLKLLENENLPKNPLERANLILNISKIVYKIRDEYLGDPRSMKVEPKKILSKEFIINMTDNKSESFETSLNGDTTFFVVTDKDGMVIAGIQSLFYAFGSGITEPNYQVTLNSRAQAFSLIKGSPNYLEPLKKPLHTLSIALIRRDQKEIFLGLSGGNLRPQFHTLLITNIADYKMDLGKALSEVRFGWIPGSNKIITDPIAVRKLRSIVKDKIEVKQGRTGVASALEIRDNGLKIFATDPRGDGCPYVTG